MIKFLLTVIIISIAPTPSPGDSGHYRKGLNMYLDGNIQGSLEELEKAYAESPRRRDVVNLYAEVLVIESGRYYESGDMKKALELITLAGELRPADEKISGVRDMLERVLNPDKAELAPPSLAREDVFAGVRKEHEERRVERVEIIREPPEKITVRELELLRPILIEQERKDSGAVYYAAGGALLVILVFMVFTGLWIKNMGEANRESLRAVSRSADEKVRRLEEEIKRRRKEELACEFEEKESGRKREMQVIRREEKLKKEYAQLLTESMSSAVKRPPREVPEPGLSESESEQKQRTEIIRSFKSLQRSDYRGAVSLLKRMGTDKNPWIRLWAGDLSLKLNPDDAVNILKGLAGDSEYQVKKGALKALGELSRQRISPELLESIRNIKSQVRGEGWVM